MTDSKLGITSDKHRAAPHKRIHAPLTEQQAGRNSLHAAGVMWTVWGWYGYSGPDHWAAEMRLGWRGSYDITLTSLIPLRVGALLTSRPRPRGPARC